jgi:hypothetical protein
MYPENLRFQSFYVSFCLILIQPFLNAAHKKARTMRALAFGAAPSPV